jgi:hypothetical protein
MNSRATSQPGGHTSVDDMPPRTAIFYAEHPFAILRDFPDERDRAEVVAAVEHALATVADDDPLAHTAWRRRQEARIRGVVGAGEAARRILAWQRLGTPTPAMPDAPGRE